MLPKLDPIPDPAFLSRHTAVKSMNPTGVIDTLPIRICSGDVFSSFPAGWSIIGTAGIIGVVLATSPSGSRDGFAGNRGAAVLALVAACGLAAAPLPEPVAA